MWYNKELLLGVAKECYRILSKINLRETNGIVDREGNVGGEEEEGSIDKIFSIKV